MITTKLEDLKFIKQTKIFFIITFIVNLILILSFYFFKNTTWALGSFFGSFLLIGNLCVFCFFIKKEILSDKKNTTLKSLLTKFYFLFFISSIFCFIVIKFKLGSPIAFLINLMSLLPCIIFTFLFFLIKKKN